jgi:hypothetical protein
MDSPKQDMTFSETGYEETEASFDLTNKSARHFQFDLVVNI